MTYRGQNAQPGMSQLNVALAENKLLRARVAELEEQIEHGWQAQEVMRLNARVAELEVALEISLPVSGSPLPSVRVRYRRR